MIESLIQSGVFPLELNGKKTLDLLAEEEDNLSEGLLDDSFKMLLGDRSGCTDDSIRRMKALPQIQVGISHEADGPFAEWYKKEHEESDEESEEESSEKDQKKAASSTSPRMVNAVTSELGEPDSKRVRTE